MKPRLPSFEIARNRQGMTLVELLVALAIFLGLIGMVLEVMHGGLGLWSRGERSRSSAIRAAYLLDRMGKELRHVLVTDGGSGEPRRKFYCDMVERDSDRDGVFEHRAQRLLFVRRLFEETTDPQLLRAGSDPEATDYYVGERGAEEAAPALRATESMVEVAYLLFPDRRPGYEGRLALWRAVRSPIGGPDSLFAKLQVGQASLNQVPMQVAAENLLHLGFEFVLRPEDLLEEEVSQTWDSTRGILVPGRSEDSFRFGVGDSSLANPDDDLFPAAVRVTLVIAEPPGESEEAFLTESLGTEPGVPCALLQDAWLRKLGAGPHRVRIDQEWLELTQIEGRWSITARGLWNTRPGIHEAGSRVCAGRVFRRTIRLPMARALPSGGTTP